MRTVLKVREVPEATEDVAALTVVVSRFSDADAETFLAVIDGDLTFGVSAAVPCNANTLTTELLGLGVRRDAVEAVARDALKALRTKATWTNGRVFIARERRARPPQPFVYS